MDETETALRQTTIIWAALDEAETELEKQQADASVLKRVVQTILDATKAVASYCVNLGDQFAQSAAQEAGKLAGKAVVIAVSGTILAQNDQIQAFARALARFVSSFGG